jgi:hypothetical protein
MSSHQPGNAVEVWAPDGKPALLGWNGHLYTVTSVIEHWTTEVQQVEHGTEDAIPDEAWTVEALSDTKAGSTVGVYELRHYPTTSKWLVAKIEEA